MQQTISRLLPRHFQILDLCLAGNGTKEIAQAVEMSSIGVGLIINSPIFQHELARRRGGIEKVVDAQLANIPTRAKQLLEDHALAAAQTHVALLDVDFCPDPRVRQKSADAILDRVFGNGKDQQQKQVVILEAGAIQLLQLALAESGTSVELRTLALSQSLETKLSDQILEEVCEVVE